MTQKMISQDVASTSHDPVIALEIDRYVTAMRADHVVNERGILEPSGQGPDCLLRCSKDRLDFAAESFKKILSGLKDNGCEIEFNSVKERNYGKPTRKVLVKLGKGQQELRIEEASTRRERVLNASERKKKELSQITGSWFYVANRWIYTPTGKPKLIFDYYKRRVIGKDDSTLVSVVLEHLREQDRYAMHREREDRRDRIRYLKKLRKLRQKLWEKDQISAIRVEAKNWSRAERLRSYVARIEALREEYEVDDWLSTARKLIDELDPIVSERFGLLVKPPKYTEVEKIWQSRHNRHYF